MICSLHTRAGDRKPSLWLRNIQLALYCGAIAAVSVVLEDDPLRSSVCESTPALVAYVSCARDWVHIGSVFELQYLAFSTLASFVWTAVLPILGN